MSGEREVWRVAEYPSQWKGLIDYAVVAGERVVFWTNEKADADQIVREHNAYQDAVAALEKIVLTASSADDPMTVQQRWTKAVRLADAALQSIKEQGA